MDVDNDNDDDGDDAMMSQGLGQGVSQGVSNTRSNEKITTAHTSSRALVRLWSWVDRVEAIIATQQQQQQHNAATTHASTSALAHQDPHRRLPSPTVVISLTSCGIAQLLSATPTTTTITTTAARRVDGLNLGNGIEKEIGRLRMIFF